MVLINHYFVVTIDCLVVTIDYLVVAIDYLVVTIAFLVVTTLELWTHARIVDPR